MKLIKILNEVESFNGLDKITKKEWGKGVDGSNRHRRSLYVSRDRTPLVVLYTTGEMSVTFSARSISSHSTTGKSHVVRVTFFPDNNRKDSISSFVSLQNKLGNLDKNKPIPKDVISRSDLKNMRCKVHCTCPDYVYRMEYSNSQKGNSNIESGNGEPPVITNPSEKQGMCKHLLRLIQWLSGGGAVSAKISGERL